MNKKKLHILYSWLLLLCFMAGQYAVYAHQHLFVKPVFEKVYASGSHHHHQQQQTTVKEKCGLCDAMHHQSAVMAHTFCFVPQAASLYLFKAGDYSFVSIGLILAAGRAPPVLS